MNTPPAGWHPDPENIQRLRYWDGQQWTSATQPMPDAQTPTLETPEQKKDRKRQLVAIGIIIAAVASIAIFKSIDFSKDDTETAAAETTTTQAARTTTTARTTTAGAATTPLTTSAVPTSTTLPVAAQTSKPLPAACKTPAQSIIDQIDASFIEADRHLEDVFMVYGRKDVAYIGANIMDSAGTRVSSADIWAQSDGMLFSLSSDARRRTALPDGRKLLDFSAGDESDLLYPTASWSASSTETSLAETDASAPTTCR